MSAEKSSSWFGLSKLEVAVVIGVKLVLIAILLPAVQRARDAAQRTQWRYNLKQIGFALRVSRDVFHFFAPLTRSLVIVRLSRGVCRGRSCLSGGLSSMAHRSLVSTT